jgi:ABC-type cobalamin/Fe3+-siderophores transport system ATPase subunit
MFQRAPWVDLNRQLTAKWRQGEHTIVIAPTGRGKTVLMQQLMPKRRDVVFFGTKTFDEEYERLRSVYGYRRVTKWPPPAEFSKVMLWPQKGKDMAETREIQRAVFSHALSRIFDNGKWTVCFDELHWMSQALKLGDDIAHMHHQGRSSKLTLIDGFQRPAFVPVIVYSSATHVFAWGTNTAADIQRLQSVAKLDALSKKEIAALFGSLDKHEFVYVNTADTSEPVISKVEL